MDCRSHNGPHAHRLVGDPVDVVTGANTDEVLDFKLDGPVPLLWRRHYSSLRHRESGSLGWGHTHEYDRTLRFDLDGMRYVRPAGDFVAFPVPAQDGESTARDGVTLLRVSARVYHVAEPGRPLFEFAFTGGAAVTPLSRVLRGTHALAFGYLDGRLVEIADPATGRAIAVASDDRGRIVRLTMAGSGSEDERPLCRYEYDAAGNLVRGVDPYGNAFGFAYDAENRMTRKTDRNGYAFEFAYDGHGRCVSSRGEDGLQEVHLRYMPTERATEVTKADGGVWLYQYDAAGTVTQIVDPYGGIQSFQMDEAGRLAQQVDPNGNATQWLYTSSGALAAKRLPLGDRVAPTADFAGPPFVDHRVAANPAEWEYGDLARRAGILQTAGRPDAPLPPEPLVGEVGYRASAHRSVTDLCGKLVRQQGPNGAARRWLYDANGNVSRYTDLEGAQYIYEHSSWNLLRRHTDPVGGVVALAYTPSERLGRVRDPGGTVSEYGYDLKDRLTEVRRHAAVKERYGYDPANNLVEKRDGQGNLLLSIEIGPGNLKTARRLASGENHYFKYDERGRYVEVSTDEFANGFAYDDVGNRVLDQRDGRGVAHRFDGLHLSETVVLDRFVVRYEHGAGGKLTLIDPGGARHVIAPEGEGGIRKTLSNHRVERVRYDADGRCLEKLLVGGRSGDADWRRSYAYSLEGDLLSVRDSQGGETRYAYDPAHRIGRLTQPDGRTLEFRFDPAGNLIEQPGLSGVSVGDGNRIAQANGDRFEFNARNAIATRAGSGGMRRYSYDARDMLARVEVGDSVWEARYDPLGRRVSKSWNGGTTEFFWDTDRLAAEIDPEGRLRVYVYVDALALVPLLFIDYEGVDAAPESGTRYYVFCDQIGTPVRVEDERAVPVWRARISPFGAARVEGSGELDVSLRFPGHYHDPETGLHYNRFRYYSPELGRYLQSDPVGIGGGLNLYAYVPNPLTQVDVRGLTCTEHPAGHNPDCEDCLDNETTQVTGRPRPGPDPDTVERCGPPSPASTWRQSEVPYQHPPEMYEVRPGQPIDFNQLDPNRTYLWVVTPDGRILIAPEDQPNWRSRPVKHGDLTPGEEGAFRGPARGGGELKVARDSEGGSPTWVMNNESSYTFAREDGTTTTGDNLQAAHDLLTQSGSDTSNVVPINTNGAD